VLLLSGLLALMGLLVGSFLNVVVWRVPRGESVVRPPSACPACGAPVRPRDNVPVLSWLLLRGRCRDCAAPVSRRYPAVELATAALFVVLGLRVGADAALPAFLYVGAVGLALALIDVDTHKLPDALTLPSYPVVAGMLGLAALLGADGSFVRALLGGAALYAVYFLLCWAYPKGMGFGDVKLSGVLGMATAWFGWGAWAVGLFAGFLLGGLWGVGLLLSGRGDRKTAVPYGPFLLVGALVAVLCGQQLASGYLDLFAG
jgi:leader peptidase (prepilin peptidase) / N-methyltransferase